MIQVLKFGGSSLATSERIKNAASIVKNKREETHLAVVVSALGGVTDELIAIMKLAGSGNLDWETRFSNLEEHHINTALESVGSEKLKTLVEQFNDLFIELKRDLNEIYQAGTLSPQKKDLVLSYGERLSSRLFSSVLTDHGLKSHSYDSFHFIKTDDHYGNANVDTETSTKLIREHLHPVNGSIPVITGFIGSTPGNEITTLGRSGSDYSAGIIGKALGAKIVEIWTDVSGVFTTDPNMANTALPISRLSYAEMTEMAHFGAKVLHPRTVLPLQKLNIPISIKNTFEPDAEGTLITNDSAPSLGSIRSVSLKSNCSLINLKSRGLATIFGLLSRALTALEQAGIVVLFNATTSSELGISLVIPEGQGKQGQQILKATFRSEIEALELEEPELQENLSMVTVIGEKLRNDSYLTGTILSVLGENNIVPLAHAKEIENRHFSFIVPTITSIKAIRLINEHFCVATDRIRLFVAGLGTIGGELLKQLADLKDTKIDYSIIGACNTKKMIWDPNGIDPLEVPKRLENGDITDWQLIIDKLVNEYSYRTIFIDATGHHSVARQYKKLLSNGVNITTPSKLANTFEQDYFDDLMRLSRNTSAFFKYETTVGAGLPVIQTIDDLIASGDKIEMITGAVSGTMTYLFNELEKGESFSKCIRKAKEQGYTEPDPRDDLFGEDVVRKFLTLARASGYRLERADLEVESLVPDDLKDVSVEEFLAGIEDYDEYWDKRVHDALKEGKVLRYIGTLKEGKIKVGVQLVSKSSPLGSLAGTDNQFAFYTRRYNKYPLIIQGPGAGREVTAAGLLSDIQKIAQNVIKPSY